MNASLRDLATRAGAVAAPPLDLAALVSAGETRIRRRRLAAVAAVTAAVVAVVGGVALAGPGTRRTAPQPAVTDHTTQGPDVLETRPAQRLLTYAVGTTIHWGERTIDVRNKTTRRPGGRLVDYVDATDDGAVFVTGQALVHDGGGWGLPDGPAAVWFTDGSAPVRIGTTSGSRVRGFGVAPSAEGSTLVWIDPGTKTRPGGVVVYDTAQMRELARLGDASAVPLEVYDDLIYWSPDGSACSRYLWGAAYWCEQTARVMRFDTTSGQQSPVSTADYEKDRRGRLGMLTGHSDVDQVRHGVMFLNFVRRGDRLVAGGQEPGVVFTPTVVLTGQPLRLRLPAGYRRADDLTMTRWLDPDHVVLVGTASHDRTDLLVCRLSTGRCRVAVRITDHGNLTAPGPAVSHG